MTAAPVSFADLLARHAFLLGAPADRLARLAAQARWIEAGPNETVIEFDDATTDVFFVLQGAVRVLVHTADGDRTQIFSDFRAGDIVGEMSAIDGAPRSARVEALLRSRLCVVSAAGFLEMASTAPAVSLRLLRLLTARIRMQNQRLMEHAALPTGLRLAAELLRLGRPLADGTVMLSPPPTQEELAARIGTRRETVSRELSALVRNGSMRRTPAKFVLNDPEELRRRLTTGLD